MKTIHKLVLKSFFGPLLITFSISMVVLLMQFIWKYVDDLVGKGLDFSIILRFLYYAALTLVPMALPLTILLASLMSFGNMGERYELVAIKSAGISIGRLMRPLFVVVIAISALAFFFSNNVYPYAFLKYRTLLHDIQTKKPALNINEREYYRKIDGYVIRFDKKDRDGKTIHDVQIFDHSDNIGNVRLTTAKNGRMESTPDGKNLLFTLFDGHSYDENVKDFENRATRPFTRIKFEEQKIRFDLSSFAMAQTNEGLFSNHQKMLNIAQLNSNLDTLQILFKNRIQEVSNGMKSRYHFFNTYYKDSAVSVPENVADFSLEHFSNTAVGVAATSSQSLANDVGYYMTDILNREENIKNFEIEWHRKFTLSLACLLLFLVGAPLGAIIRKGGLGMPVVVSVLLFIAYHVLSMIGERSLSDTPLEVWKGMWIAPLVFLPVGIFFILKATSDSRLMDADIWWQKLHKLFLRK